MSSGPIKISFGPSVSKTLRCYLAASLSGRKLAPVPVEALNQPILELPSALVNESILVGALSICRYLVPTSDREGTREKILSLDEISLQPFLEDFSIDLAQNGLKELDLLISSKDIVSTSISLENIFIYSTLQASFDSNVSNFTFLDKHFPTIIAFYNAFKEANIKKIQSSIKSTNQYLNKGFPKGIPESFPVVTAGFPFVKSLSLFFHSTTLESFPFLGQSFSSSLEEGRALKKGSVAPALQYSVALKVAGQIKNLQNTSLKECYSHLKSPKDIASLIVSQLSKNHFLMTKIVEKFEVAGPGFINVYLKDQFGTSIASQVLANKQLEPKTAHNVSTVSNGSYMNTDKLKVGIDMSGPNVAKEMHVGHLRSTVIGEALSRILRHRGHEVVKINHIGDWGTQFGMLLTYLQDAKQSVTPGETSLAELNVIYKQAKQRFDEDEDFKARSRAKVVDLQSGSEPETTTWKKLISISESGFEEIYKRLDVKFEDGNCGESFYQNRIPSVIEKLKSKGLLVEYEGAKIVKTDVCKVPLFIQKSDGGYGYDSTDMTALYYRFKEINVDQMLYVVDLGQTNHFKSCFEAAQKMGWFDQAKKGPHFVGFGLVCGKDGKRFRSRSGESVTLRSLLDEAVKRIKEGLVERVASGDTSLTEDMIDSAAGKLGYSAIKFFDLRNTREKDYVFDYDQMLQPMGNTGVYIIYTYARVCSIERKIKELLNLDIDQVVDDVLKKDILKFSKDRAKEWDIIKVLLKYGDTIASVEEHLAPQHMCTFVYDLCVAVSKFYTEHQLIVKDPAHASGKGLDKEFGIQWLCLLHITKLVIEETAPLIGIQLLDRV